MNRTTGPGKMAGAQQPGQVPRTDAGRRSRELQVVLSAALAGGQELVLQEQQRELRTRRLGRAVQQSRRPHA